MSNQRFSRAIAAAALVTIGSVALHCAAVAQEDSPPDSEIEALKAEVAALRNSLPSQSHTMADVEFHFANLWFAGKNEAWPLATFYLNETRSHLNWTVRLHPVRRLSNGELDLRPMLASIESSGLAALKSAIDDEDPAAFDSAYRAMMSQCYACHVAAEKPFLQPHVPSVPPSPMINRPIGDAVD